MNKTMHKQVHVGMAMMLLLALTNGLVNPFAVGGRTDTPAEITTAKLLGQGAVELDIFAVEGGQALARAGCILCVGGILFGGGASIVGLIALAAAAPFATGACAFVCTLGYG